MYIGHYEEFFKLTLWVLALFQSSDKRQTLKMPAYKLSTLVNFYIINTID